MKMSENKSYGDLIKTEYPYKNKDIKGHQRMAVSDRAKQFMPFAALKGYEEEINERIKK